METARELSGSELEKYRLRFLSDYLVLGIMEMKGVEHATYEIEEGPTGLISNVYADKLGNETSFLGLKFRDMSHDLAASVSLYDNYAVCRSDPKYHMSVFKAAEKYEEEVGDTDVHIEVREQPKTSSLEIKLPRFSRR